MAINITVGIYYWDDCTDGEVLVRNWFHKHPFLFSYFIVIGFSLYGFRQLRASDTHNRQAQASLNVEFCRIVQTSYNQRRAIVLKLTAPGKLNLALVEQEKLGDPVAKAIHQQVDEANARKLQQQKDLLKLGGPAPSC